MSETRRRHPSGSMLVLTLWLVAILAVLSAAVAGHVAMEIRLSRYHRARAQARAWARAGVFLALSRLVQDAQEDPHDWLGDDWAHVPSSDPAATPAIWVVSVPDEGRLTIEIIDEERKLDLNKAEEPLLTRFLGNNAEIARAIIAYRDTTDEGIDTTVQPPYAPKNAPIDTLAELWEIPILAALIDPQNPMPDSTLTTALRSHSTVVTEGSINLNTAEASVLEAVFESVLPGQGLALAQGVVDFRWDPGDATDPATGNRFTQLKPSIEVEGAGVLDPGIETTLATLMTGPLGSLLGVQSNRFSVVVEAQLMKPVVYYRIEAIVTRDPAEPEKSTVRAWREG